MVGTSNRREPFSRIWMEMHETYVTACVTGTKAALFRIICFHPDRVSPKCLMDLLYNTDDHSQQRDAKLSPCLSILSTHKHTDKHTRASTHSRTHIKDWIFFNVKVSYKLKYSCFWKHLSFLIPHSLMHDRRRHSSWRPNISRTWTRAGQAGVPQQDWGQSPPQLLYPTHVTYVVCDIDQCSASGCWELARPLCSFHLYSCTVGYKTWAAQNKVKIGVPCSKK